MEVVSTIVWARCHCRPSTSSSGDRDRNGIYTNDDLAVGEDDPAGLQKV
jgi:hypothetical protein